ncbi:hypothetical protein U1Q18_020810, partial [Sarracenia purpurea var. burkii]
MLLHFLAKSEHFLEERAEEELRERGNLEELGLFCEELLERANFKEEVLSEELLERGDV